MLFTLQGFLVGILNALSLIYASLYMENITEDESILQVATEPTSETS
jgi:hypothetical protein